MEIVFDVKAHKQCGFTDIGTQPFGVLNIGKVTERYFTIVYLNTVGNRLATRRERIPFIYSVRLKVEGYDRSAFVQ